MAAEASFILRAVDSTKAAFASVQNSLGKLRNESEVAGGFFKKAFDLKNIGMGLAVSSGISLVAITNLALSSITEYLTRFDRINQILDEAAAAAAIIYKNALRDRMTDEEKIAAITTEQLERTKQIDALTAKQTTVRTELIQVGGEFIEQQRVVNELTEEEAKLLGGLEKSMASEGVALAKLKIKIKEKNKEEDLDNRTKKIATLTDVYNKEIEIFDELLSASKKINDEDVRAFEKRKQEKEQLISLANSWKVLIDANFQYKQDLIEIDRLSLAGRLSAQEANDAKAFALKRSLEPAKKANEQLQDEADKYKALADPMFQINKERERMIELVAKQVMTQSEADAALVVMIDKTKEATNLANDMGFAFASAFESAVLGGESAGNAMKALARDIMQVFLRLAVTNQIINAIFGASGLGLGGKGFQPLPTIGTRANGGPVSAGSPYLVGERGPELFVPKGSGTVMPNGAGGTSVNITYNIASGVSRSDLAPILEQQRKLLKAEIPDMVRRGGGYRAAFA